MKEYWVNVYDDYAIGACMVNKKLCREIARKLKYMIASKVIYRIHVKMKEPRPKYEPPFIGMKLSNGGWI